MTGRIAAGAVSALAGTLWVSAAFAASVQTPASAPEMKLASRDTVTLDRSGHLVDLGLGSVMPRAAAAPLAWRAPTASGFQLNYARDRNLDLFGNLLPGGAGLRSTYLLGSSTSFAGSYALPDGVSLGLAHSTLELSSQNPNLPSALTRDLAGRLTGEHPTELTTANLNWNFADWGGLGVTASQGNGIAALLGASSGSLTGSSALSTTALGVSARVGFGEGWVTSVTYSEGVSQLDLSSTGIATNSDPLHSEGYGISVAKQGLFGSDSLGIAVSRPLQIYTGNSNLASLNSLSTTQAHESDVELGYVTTFLDGTLALQANAAYQMNAAGAKGQNALAGVARAKINF